jgi:prepilin-type N-terminal cleavage/methylation domain-containing protein
MRKNQNPDVTSGLRTNCQLPNRGFTLVELLVALLISSIIFLVIVSTYSSTINTIEKWDRREEDYYLARNIFRRMRSEISSLHSISNSQNYSKSDTSTLEGDEKSLSFYTQAESLYFPCSCLVKVTYEFVIGDDERSLLIREEEPWVNFSLEENVHLKSYVWSEDLKDLSFQYSDGKKWYDEWDSKEGEKTLQAVRVVLISPHEEKFSTIIYIPTEI